MSEELSLLKALCEELGYKVTSYRENVGGPDWPNELKYFKIKYKLEKKHSPSLACKKCGTHLPIGAPLDSCLCSNRDNLYWND